MSGALALCDRCKFRKRDRELRLEWTNLRVCNECWDPRPPWLDAPVINPMEAAPVPNARLDHDATNPIFIDTEVTPDDL